MARRACFAAILASALAGCPEPLTLSDPAGTRAPSTPDGGAASAPAGDPLPMCGGRLQPCCVDTGPECAENLRCNAVTETCVLADSEADAPNCQSDADCADGATCCPTQGLFRWCRRLEPGGACPLPDLGVLVPVGSALLIDEPLIAVGEPSYYNNLNYEPACILEKECVRAPGARRLLRFESSVVNLGEADLVLGASGVTPQVRVAACNGQPYVQNYLRYELVDDHGAVAASNEGRMLPPACVMSFGGPTTTPPPRFNCGLLGVPVGVVETYDSGSTDCQWVDITGVPAGQYVLRVTVNPDRVWPESNYENNSLELPIALPSFDQLAPCEAQSTNARGYSYNNGEPWCGWSAAPSALECEPGERVQLSCPDCTGNPRLRVCEGAAPCEGAAAWATGDDTYREEDGSLSACPSGLCELVSSCPTVNFGCPPSGTYTWLVNSNAPLGSATCNAVQSP
jgi:lysyl oxidase